MDFKMKCENLEVKDLVFKCKCLRKKLSKSVSKLSEFALYGNDKISDLSDNGLEEDDELFKATE